MAHRHRASRPSPAGWSPPDRWPSRSTSTSCAACSALGSTTPLPPASQRVTSPCRWPEVTSERATTCSFPSSSPEPSSSTVFRRLPSRPALDSSRSRWSSTDPLRWSRSQRRRERPEQQVHLDAGALVERSEVANPVGEMFDRYLELLDHRSGAHRVEVRRTGIDDRVEGDVEATVRDIEALLR